MLDKKVKVYDVDAWLNPVIHGTLTWPDGKKVTNVWLIKAAWNEKAARASFENSSCGGGYPNFNCLVAMFWGTRLTSDADEHMVKAFPQHGTATNTLNSSPTLILAYRELGRMAASHLTRDSTGKISLLDSQQINEKGKPVREDGKQQCYQEPAGRGGTPQCFSLP